MPFTFDSFPFQRTATTVNQDGGAFEIDCQLIPVNATSVAIYDINKGTAPTVASHQPARSLYRHMLACASETG
jgi:hypothetical protein